MDFRDCTICDKPNQEGNTFCIHCGAELPKSGTESTSKDIERVQKDTGEPTKHSIKAIHIEVYKLRKEVDELRKKLHILTTEDSNFVKSRSDTSPTRPKPAFPSQRSQTQSQTRKLLDWEQVPGDWFARIGGLAILIGVAFFLALAFDNHWIEATGQVVIGITAGLFFLSIGEYWQKEYKLWSQSISGTGIAILYASIYAAFGIHELINAYIAFAILIVITFTTAGLSLRYHALPLAVLAVIGGLATPLFFNKDLPEVHLMIPYILILDLGVLVLASLRNWRWLTLIAVIGSYGLIGNYMDHEGGLSLTVLQTGLTLIFLIFVGATTLFHLIWRKVPEYTDLGLITLNAAIYFAITYDLLEENYIVWLPLVSLSLVVVYGLIAYASIRRGGVSNRTTIFLLLSALTFLSITIPIQFDGEWVTIALAVKSASLIYAGFYLNYKQVRIFGLALLPIVAFRLITYETFPEPETFTLLLNLRILTFVLSIICVYLSSYFYLRYESDSEKWESSVSPILSASASFFSLWIISAEAIRYFDNTGFKENTRENAKLLSLSLLWAIYAAIGLTIGNLMHSKRVRLGALTILAVATLKLFLIDSLQLDREYSVVAFISLGLLLLSIGFFYQKHHATIKDFFLGQD
jgi:uncharacterized membrane protein